MNNKYNREKYYENREKILLNRKKNYKSKRTIQNNISILQGEYILNFD